MNRLMKFMLCHIIDAAILAARAFHITEWGMGRVYFLVGVASRCVLPFAVAGYGSHFDMMSNPSLRDAVPIGSAGFFPLIKINLLLFEK